MLGFLILNEESEILIFLLGPVFDCLIRIRVFSRSSVFGLIPRPPHCLIQPSVGPLRMFTCTG